MPSSAPSGVGHQVAVTRIARHLTQHQLADAACVSLSMLRKIEQGTRKPSDHVLEAIAGALGVPPDRLAGSRHQTASRIHAAIPDLRSAVDNHDFPEDGPVRPLPELRSAVAAATHMRITSQYNKLVAYAPKLLDELSRAASSGSATREASELLAIAYRAADSVAYKYGYFDLSARIISLMQWQTADSDNQHLRAAIAYVRAETFFASNDLEPGLKRLEAAIDRAPTSAEPDSRAVLGALHMRAAVAAGRMNHADHAWSHLHEAHDLADSLPDGIYHGTAFGPSSVHVHQVSVAVELGQADKAVELARSWAPSRDLPAERRSHYYIDLARAQLWLGLREDAFESLQVARRIAPQHAREHPYVREVLTTLVRLHISPPQALVSYADWARVI